MSLRASTLLFVLGVPCLGDLASVPGAFSVAFAASNAAPSASEIISIVGLDKEKSAALKKGTLDSKERRALAYGALSRWLGEYLKASEIPEAKARPFAQAVLKDFSRYVPSYRVDPSGESDARVSLYVSTSLLATELEKRGASAVGAAGAAATNGVTNAVGGLKAAQTLPYTALLVDEKNREIYVTPPEAVASFAIENEAPEDHGFRFKPAAVLKAISPTDANLNSVTTPLSQRATQFSNKFLFHMQNKALVYKPDWTKQILSFIETSARVAKDRGETRAWPPALPWSLSSLYTHPGLLVVFTVRSDDKSGTLERVDVVGSGGGRFLRHYWSRAMHDPGYQETPAKALEKAATGFARLHRVKRPEAVSANLGFWIDRRVPDRDVVALENVLRGFALGEDVLLIPTEITKEDVRYQSPVPASRAEKVLERVKRGTPGVNARLASGEPPVILLGPQAAPPSQPK